MLKMLKGLVTSPKKDNTVDKVKDCKELNLRPQEGSLTAHWILKQKN